LSKILEFRHDEIILKTSTAMQYNLNMLKRITFENVEENRNLSQIATQSQKDSQTLKALTMIATMYLPASLIAVGEFNIYHLIE
jgi:Mg2+ and Co2+ transporter CorA